MHKTITATILTTAVLLGGAAAPADAALPPLPPDGPPATCWVDVTWFPNPENLPPCSADAQPTLYRFARALLVWQDSQDILSGNLVQLERVNHRHYMKIKRLRREVRHLRAELAAANR